MNNTKKKRRVIWSVVAVALLMSMIAGSLLFSNYTGKLVANGILKQNENIDTKGNSIKQLAQWNYDLEGFRKMYSEITISFEAEDGNVVPAVILLPHDKSLNTEELLPTAILVHGAGGDHVCTYPVAEIYLEMGYQVLTIDQRASGDSTNEWVSFGYFESLDVKAAVDYARNKMNAESVVVHGQSMGGLTLAVYSSSEHASENVDAFVLDSAINGMEYVFRGMMSEEGLSEVAVDYIVFCGDLYLHHHYGFGFDDLDAVSNLERNMVPTLILYAKEDDLVTKEQTEAMFDAVASEQKEMISFSCGHIESIIKYKQESSDAIMAFFEQ